VCTAGVAAARGGNGIGTTGAAPFASLAGLRVDFHAQDLAQFADATLYHSSSGNIAVSIKNHSYGGIAPYVPAAAERNALATSSASGAVHCFAAGNSRNLDSLYLGVADSNKQPLQNSP